MAPNTYTVRAQEKPIDTYLQALRLVCNRTSLLSYRDHVDWLEY